MTIPFTFSNTPTGIRTLRNLLSSIGLVVSNGVTDEDFFFGFSAFNMYFYFKRFNSDRFRIYVISYNHATVPPSIVLGSVVWFWCPTVYECAGWLIYNSTGFSVIIRHNLNEHFPYDGFYVGLLSKFASSDPDTFVLCGSGSIKSRQLFIHPLVPVVANGIICVSGTVLNPVWFYLVSDSTTLNEGDNGDDEGKDVVGYKLKVLDQFHVLRGYLPFIYSVANSYLNTEQRLACYDSLFICFRSRDSAVCIPEVLT